MTPAPEGFSAVGDAARPVRRSGTTAVDLDENVAFYDETGQLMILLNSSAVAIWERCDGAKALGDIADELVALHPSESADIAEDVRRTVAKLMELGLVVEGDGTVADAT